MTLFPPMPRMTEEQALNTDAEAGLTTWQAIRFCVPWLKPYVAKLVLVCLADVAVLALSLIPPWFATYMIDRAFPVRDWEMMRNIVIWMIVVGIVLQAITAFRDYLYAYVEIKIQLDLRNRMYRKLQRLSMRTIDARPIGQMVFRVIVDSDRVGHTIYRIIPTAFMLVQFGLLFAYTSYVDPLITGIVLLFLIPWTVLFHWVTTIGRVLDRRRLWCGEMRDSCIQQAASSFAVTRAFGKERHEIRKHGKHAGAVQRMGNNGYLILVFFEFATVRLIPFAKTTTIALYFARKVILGDMTLGMTIPMAAYLGRLTYPLERITNFYNWVRQTMVSTERMMQIMLVEPDIEDRPKALKLPEVTGAVELRNVSYAHPGKGLILKDVSMKFEPGTTTALIGPSGAGKSTISGMILRLQEASEGQVLIDGHDIRDIKLSSFLEHVAVVPQETFIFGGTIADNVRLGKPKATDTEVSQTLKLVGLGEWLENLPDGIATDLQSGQGLSVGQKQRIGIARAVISTPRLVILDEPTSALDTRTERAIMATIRSVFASCTVLMISHRLDTIFDADQIVVLDAGEVVETGTHRELLNNDGLYSRLREAYGDVPTLTEKTR